jgi:hypothetical protein
MPCQSVNNYRLLGGVCYDHFQGSPRRVNSAYKLLCIQISALYSLVFDVISFLHVFLTTLPNTQSYVSYCVTTQITQFVVFSYTNYFLHLFVELH